MFEATAIACILIIIACLGAACADDLDDLVAPQVGDVTGVVNIIGGDDTTYVKHAVAELASYLGELGVDKPGVAIYIGLDESKPSIDQVGEEGYILRSETKGETIYVTVAGATPRGTMNAIYALMKRIRVVDGRVSFDIPHDIISKPAFAKRGMHLNGWAFRSPYTFRNWTEDDWRRYIDILSYQGVNLLYIWPFIEIMPVPFSPEDEAYLKEVRRVVDYAQTEHGMEVWMMQCTNRVAKDNCGVTDPRRRPYWRPSQEDLNPADPESYKAIMDSRKALYTIVDNVDGVCTIDSDPGWCPGSPLSDFMKVLKGCRALLDKHNIHGKDAKIINWMWCGWGLEGSETCSLPFMRKTIQAMKNEMPEPWMLISGINIYLPLCKEEGVLDHTIYLPYGHIEDEPSYPTMNIGFDGIRSIIAETADYPGLRGVMGNVQCPIVQLPRCYDFLSAIWDTAELQRPERDVLVELSQQLYSEHADLMADGYLSLRESELTKVDPLVAQLDTLTKSGKLGRSGAIGRRLFPDSQIAAHMLLLQMKLHASKERFYQQLTPDADRAMCSRLLEGMLDAYLTWDIELGWHDLWGRGSWALAPIAGDERFNGAVANLRRILGDDAAVNTFFNELQANLSKKHNPDCVAGDAVDLVRNSVLSALILSPTMARDATATASVLANAEKYPARNANDGEIGTLYWPGALTDSNAEWLQLTWDKPQTFSEVNAYFLRHDSMWNRTIHLQHESAPGKWEDIATCTPTDTGAYALARFPLPTAVTADKIRIVNLLDLFEIEVR